MFAYMLPHIFTELLTIIYDKLLTVCDKSPCTRILYIVSCLTLKLQFQYRFRVPFSNRFPLIVRKLFNCTYNSNSVRVNVMRGYKPQNTDVCELYLIYGYLRTDVCELYLIYGYPRTDVCELYLIYGYPRTDVCELYLIYGFRRTDVCELYLIYGYPRTYACELYLIYGYPRTDV